MFVQMDLSQFENETGYMGEAFCHLCGGSIGRLDVGEVRALLSGRYGQPLCFSCENCVPQKWVVMSGSKKARLARLYKIGQYDDLPTTSTGCWYTPDGKLLQHTEKNGWFFWVPNNDGLRVLNSAKLSDTDAKIIRTVHKMLPGMLV